jgi:hypothetical protein
MSGGAEDMGLIGYDGLAITRETFDKMDEQGKQGTIYDYLSAIHREQRQYCANMDDKMKILEESFSTRISAVEAKLKMFEDKFSNLKLKGAVILLVAMAAGGTGSLTIEKVLTLFGIK